MQTNNSLQKWPRQIYIYTCVYPHTTIFNVQYTRPTSNATPNPIAIVVTQVTCGHYWICAKNTKQNKNKNKVLLQYTLVCKIKRNIVLYYIYNEMNIGYHRHTVGRRVIDLRIQHIHTCILMKS